MGMRESFKTAQPPGVLSEKQEHYKGIMKDPDT